jgi:putative chitinase
MPVTRERILEVAPAADPYVDELLRQMEKVGITTPLRAAHFLGQIMVESAGFKATTENLNYSADGLANTWPSRYAEKAAGKYVRIPVKGKMRYKPNALAVTIQRNPESIANNTYANRMGNGAPETGHGWKYIGRGLKMLTGLTNYLNFSKWWLGSDALLAHPYRVAEPAGAVASAVWFWATNQLNPVADRDSVEAVTRVVNGGEIGLADRQKWTAAFKKAFA